MHARGLTVVDLHAVHANVALTAFGVPGNHAGKGNEAAAIQRPALEYREIEDVEVFPQDHLLTRGVIFFHRAREKPAHPGQHGQHLQLAQQALRRLEVEQSLDSSCYVVKTIDIERHLHAPLAAKLVHQHPAARVSFYLFKQQCRATRSALDSRAFAPLGDSIGNLGDLENGVYRLLDAL